MKEYKLSFLAGGGGGVIQWINKRRKRNISSFMNEFGMARFVKRNDNYFV